MKILDASQMQAMDRRAMEEIGLIGPILMENAGLAVVREILEVFPRVSKERIVVVCGKGNNGGDGFVVARHLFNRGCRPLILLLAKKAELRGDAGLNLTIADNFGIPIREILSPEDWDAEKSQLDLATILIDAVFGTGLAKPARGLFARVIEDINQAESFKLAIDIPSGLSADSFQIIGPCVDADLTVTMAAPKIAHIFPPAEERIGRLVTADIGMPGFMFDDPELSLELVEEERVRPLFRPRDRDAHKGTFGHVFILAGSMGKTGAAVMAGEAALKSGAGLVTIGTPRSCQPVVAREMAELMTEPLDETPVWSPAEQAADRVLELAAGKDAVLIGPGISTHESTARLLFSILPRIEAPMVLDADALNILAGNPSVLKSLKPPVVLTPHPGEFARLIGKSTADVLKGKLELAPAFAREHDVILILKGYRTLTALPDGRVFVNSTGNPGMATGGSGDVLSGILAAMAAGEPDLPAAAVAAVFLHGRSGDLAASKVGEKSLVAGNIITHLPDAIQTLSKREAD